MEKSKKIIFFIGTTAEYIKLFTVIEEIRRMDTPYLIVATGQNDIAPTDITKRCNIKIDLTLSDEKDIKKNAIGLFSWFFKTKKKAPRMLRNAFPDVDFVKSVFVVHGDTISTVMGALVAKKMGAKVAHVEAGLRSHNWLKPFPEEIDRHIVSKVASLNFAPGQLATSNLKKAKGLTVNTEYNTIIDALAYSNNVECADSMINELTKQDYCVAVFHRQENLMNHKLFNGFLDKLNEISKAKHVAFIIHAITERELVKIGRFEEFKNNHNITLLRRVEYFDFMKLLWSAKYVLTDGGSNQEELAYMGKPTLVMRTETEREEGLGENAVLFKGNINEVGNFVDKYEQYVRKPCF